MKLHIIYFSPTGGTKKVADLLSKNWDLPVTEIDLSDPNCDFAQYSFQADDICIIAIPSFGGRVPQIALTRLNKIKGGNAHAVLVAVYGNRAFEDTLLELKEAAQSTGFQCFAAVSAVAEHSIIHQFAAGRPDADDQKELMEFSERIAAHLEENQSLKELIVPGNLPYTEYNGVPFKPKADKKCDNCGACVSKCPVSAIPASNPQLTEETLCISCMACVSVCPTHARDLNKVMVLAASQKMKKACKQRKPNELFLSR